MENAGPNRGQTDGLKQQSGFNLIELLIVIGIISVLAMVGLPAYTDYTVRAKISEDVARVRDVQLRILEYNLLNGAMPESNAQLGLPEGMASPATRLESFYVDSQPTPGTIKLFFDDIALPILGNDNSIFYQPEEINGRIQWDCTAGSMIERYRPAQCRASEFAEDGGGEEEG